MHPDILQVMYHKYEKSNQQTVNRTERQDMPSSQADINFILFNNLQ